MATFTKIAKPSAHHDEILYSGSDSNQTLTGLGFQPDWLHIKNRVENGDGWHNIVDTVRGIDKNIYTNSTDGQDTASRVTAITSDGFTVAGNIPYTNDADDGFIAHCFKLAGSTTTNDASATGVGTIDSSYRANQDSGISVVTWTGTGANGTIAHGLGRTPDCIIMKDIQQDGYHWEFYMHSGNAGGSPENSASSDEDHHIRFFDNDGTTDPDDDHTYFNDTKPTSTVFSIGTANNVNQSGISQMAICIANTNGSVRAGSYQGNGKTHGSFVFTGFRPRAIWTSGRLTEDPHWKTVTTRFTSNTNAAASSGGANHGNPIEHNLKFGDASSLNEQNQCALDIFSNGFSPASTDGKHNGGGYYYYYIAWAGAPMVGTNKVLGTAF
tara:strand:+ start:255 stop:1403 length:1149 start_codon:yes stop_codon:yes gene_type:complete